MWMKVLFGTAHFFFSWFIPTCAVMIVILFTLVNRDSVIIVYKINWFQQQVQNFGEPFFLVIHEGETLAEVKVRIPKKLQVPDEEFSKVFFFPSCPCSYVLLPPKTMGYHMLQHHNPAFYHGIFFQRLIILFPIIWP